MLHSMGEWLRLGADPAGFLAPEEVEEFLKLHRQVGERFVGGGVHNKGDPRLDGLWNIG